VLTLNILRNLLCLTLLSIVIFSCNNENATEASGRPSFAKIIGTRFIEVRRQFDDGYSFNSYGFQQEPEWILEFLSEDSVKIYSPFEKKFLHYPVFFDHDSIFNIAREWVRLKHVSKDSLVFQLLQVEQKVVKKDRSNVSMKFYSKEYIEKKHIDPRELQKPKARDTAYVRALIAKANKFPDSPDSLLAARKPVALISRTDAITVKQSHAVADMMDPSRAEEYLNPEYFIVINGAYKDFTHNFTVVVDEKGKMHLGRFVVDDEFRESRTRVLKGIIDVYLQKYLTIIPGKTLGIPHASEIMIYLKGKKQPI